jgi:serine/threonine protein kinase
MGNPVIGSIRCWLGLAHKVVSALYWLHNTARVIHGDIKPGNFLLRPVPGSQVDSAFPFQPIFIDFSSSHLSESEGPTLNTLSAVTREYTAPELLSSAVLRDPKSTATFASDIFSTAVTLLVAATGDIKVYPGSVFQRQAMATQGWQVLQLARSGEQGARVRRHGVVERALERAVLRAGMGRVTATQWLDIVEEMMIGDPAKKP